jgi:hypothetical protein
MSLMHLARNPACWRICHVRSDSHRWQAVSRRAWRCGQDRNVTAEVLGEGRGDKILVFHFKRKKQYKKMQGHRQNFTEVRIKAIEADGVTYNAAK